MNEEEVRIKMGSKIILLFFGVMIIVVLLAAQCSGRNTVTPGSSVLKENVVLREKLKRLCQKYKQPAMAYAVANSREILLQSAVGTAVVGEDLPVTVESRFHLGSVTKTLTAV